jgi:hypothetical protein
LYTETITTTNSAANAAANWRQHCNAAADTSAYGTSAYLTPANTSAYLTADTSAYLTADTSAYLTADTSAYLTADTSAYLTTDTSAYH